MVGETDMLKGAGLGGLAEDDNPLTPEGSFQVLRVWNPEKWGRPEMSMLICNMPPVICLDLVRVTLMIYFQTCA